MRVLRSNRVEELLCYLIDPVGIERNMPLDLHDRRKRILVGPDSVDGLFSSSGNAVVIAIAFVRTVGGVLRWFQLGKINVLTWNVLNGRIRRFAERQGVAGIGNHTARDGHDYASGITLDGNRMIWTWKHHLLFFHVSVSSFCSCSTLQELRDMLNMSCRITLPRFAM